MAPMTSTTLRSAGHGTPAWVSFVSLLLAGIVGCSEDGGASSPSAPEEGEAEGDDGGQGEQGLGGEGEQGDGGEPPCPEGTRSADGECHPSQGEPGGEGEGGQGGDGEGEPEDEPVPAGEGEGEEEGGGEGKGEGEEEGGGEGEGEGDDAPACAPPGDGCPDLAGLVWPETRNGAAGPLPVRVIIEAVDFAGDRVVLRNVSDVDITMQTWDTPLESFAHPDLPEGFVLAAGARVVFHARGHGDDDGCELWANQGAGSYDLKPGFGELAVRADSGQAAALDNLEAYVRWGADPVDAGSRLRDEAAAAGLWTDAAGAFVVTDAETLGIVATGDVTAAAGWAVSPVACFGITD